MGKYTASLKYQLKTLGLCLIFSLFFQYSTAQEALSNLRSAYENTSKNDTARFYLAGKYAQGLFFNNQEEQANKILKENIQIAVLAKEDAFTAYLYAIQAINNRIAELYTDSKYSLEKAKTYASKTANLEIKGYVSYCEGWLYVRDNKEGEAVRSFHNAINFFEQAPASPTLNSRKSSTYKELTAIYANWNEFQLQEKYGLLALQLAIKQQDPIATFDAYMAVGYMYEQQFTEDERKLENRDSAEQYYLKAIGIYNTHKNQIPLASNLSFVANNLANLYFRFFPDQYESYALHYADLARKQGLATQQYTHVASAYGIMAEIALKKKQTELAKKHLTDALETISKSSVQDQNILLSIYERLSEIAEAENKFIEAIHYHKAYMETFKSLYNQEQLELGRRLEAQFEKEQQQRELFDMQLEAEKKEQQLRLMHTVSLQHKQAFENLKLLEENQRKKLELSELEAIKRAQELKLSKLEAQRRSQDILNYQNELLYKEKISSYYISLIVIFLLVFILLLYAYKQRSKRLIQNKELYTISLEKERQNIKIATLTAMLDGQEQERGRMARDLHDGLGGLLSSTKISLSQFTNQIAPAHKQDMQNSLTQLDTAVEELRRIAHNLMPDLLNRYGLEEALQDYAVRMSNDQLDIVVQFLYYKNKLQKDKQLLVYRIIQELVNNAIKHAEATQILIQIVEESSDYTITIEDDGKGFDLKEVKGNHSAGLHNIQSRVDFLKGTFQIHSEKEVGTSITFSFPKNNTK